MPTVTTTGLATWYDWTVDQGELEQLLIPVLDDNGNPFNVSGWSVDAKVQDAPGGTTLSVWQPGDIVVSGTDVTLSILPATSNAWVFSRAFWRCKIIHPTDATQIYRIVQGNFTLLAD